MYTKYINIQLPQIWFTPNYADNLHLRTYTSRISNNHIYIYIYIYISTYLSIALLLPPTPLTTPTPQDVMYFQGLAVGILLLIAIVQTLVVATILVILFVTIQQVSVGGLVNNVLRRIYPPMCISTNIKHFITQCKYVIVFVYLRI